jgi:hypothetical protein
LGRAGADHIMAYLSKPVKPVDLQAAVRLALLRFGHFQALAKEAADLKQALEHRKVIEDAKRAVMKRARVDEAEAFRRLSKLATAQNRACSTRLNADWSGRSCGSAVPYQVARAAANSASNVASRSGCSWPFPQGANLFLAPPRIPPSIRAVSPLSFKMPPMGSFSLDFCMRLVYTKSKFR